MDIDLAKKGKAKKANSTQAKKKFCSYCKKHNPKVQNTHNTVDCKNKPKGDKSKNKSSNPSSSSSKDKSKDHKTFKAWLIKFMEEFDSNSESEQDSETDSDTSDPPLRQVEVSTARIEDIPDPLSSGTETTSSVNEMKRGNSKKQRKMSRMKLDFLKGL
ncbi:hypothetical protein AX16_009345 [Volvariella volvacea WC 439]|nr:hypothetical protein AX16_009345 [Volvariella volvacea WC 439]